MTEGTRTMLDFLKAHHFLQREMHAVTVQNMLNIYNAVVDVATSVESLPLGYKKEESSRHFYRNTKVKRESRNKNNYHKTFHVCSHNCTLS